MELFNFCWHEIQLLNMIRIGARLYFMVLKDIVWRLPILNIPIIAVEQKGSFLITFLSISKHR